MPGRLEGKIAIVTGGGSGFGKAISTKFVQEGAKVLLAEYSPESGPKVAKELGCDCIQADVTKRSDWEATLKKVIDLHGGVDIVVNNAGGCYPSKPTGEVSDDDFDLVVNLNMKSIYLSCNTIVPYMQKQGKGGCFITISSTAGIRPRPRLTWYNASKAAASNATHTMAIEYAPDNIRFNAVCPQFASTGMSHLFLGKPDTEENRAAFLKTIPLGRRCDPQDVANGCCYLASDEASFVTGIDLKVDGGRCV